MQVIFLLWFIRNVHLVLLNTAFIEKLCSIDVLVFFKEKKVKKKKLKKGSEDGSTTITKRTKVKIVHEGRDNSAFQVKTTGLIFIHLTT